MKIRQSDHIVILHNIRSAHNVGAILRTLDAAGVTRVYMTGYTPTPLDRFGRPRKDVAKAALGAERTVVWEQRKALGPLIKNLKTRGYAIAAIEQDDRAHDYKTFTPKAPTVFIFGNEVRGLSKHVLDTSDVILEIPMKGIKESLNVAVAAGVVLFRVLDC